MKQYDSSLFHSQQIFTCKAIGNCETVCLGQPIVFQTQLHLRWQDVVSVSFQVFSMNIVSPYPTFRNLMRFTFIAQ